MTLFFVVYYAFAQVGMGLFAGCVTEVESAGGPGEWTGPRWSDTDFGGAAYYYGLNFGATLPAATALL